MAKGKYFTHVQPRLEEIQGWARNGLTNEDIAHNLQIFPSTLYTYQKKHDELSEALKKTKDIADMRVENSLYTKASGQLVIWEEKAIKVADKTFDEKTGNLISITERVAVVKVHRQVVPDTGSQALWLKNRKPTVWRDNHDIDLNVPTEIIIADGNIKLNGKE